MRNRRKLCSHERVRPTTQRGFTQATAVRLAAPGDFGGDASGVQRTPVLVVIVAPVALNNAGLREGPAALAGNGRDGVNERVKLGDIVAVGAGENYGERDALRFGNEVVL